MKRHLNATTLESFYLNLQYLYIPNHQHCTTSKQDIKLNFLHSHVDREVMQLLKMSEDELMLLIK